ncbi:MAG: hypothetical protein KF850_36650 [Labilithrix sp.]|nr:hypothetical protein [Labilithrix sp.]
MTPRSHRPSPSDASWTRAPCPAGLRATTRRTATPPGARRLAAVLVAASLAGCGAPAARSPADGSLYVPPLTAPAPPADPGVVRFADGAAPPSGCFAISRRTGAVACLVGQYALEAASGERRVTFLSSADAMAPDIPVQVHVSTGSVKLAPQSQRALDTLMREGDFIALGAPVVVPVDSPQTFAGLVVELNAVALGAPDGSWINRAGAGDLKVVVRSETSDAERAARAPDQSPLLENTLSSVTCLAPSLAVRVLEHGVVLLERECRLDEGGGPEIVAGAWLCSSERARCE